MPVSQDDPRLKRVGFAKLVGENVDHIMRKYEIVLGRRSKATALDVVLGDMMSVSRQHAKIFYNFESSKPNFCARMRRLVPPAWPAPPPTFAQSRVHFPAEQFELEVLGKNGVVVDGVLHEPGATNVVLKSRAFLQIGTEVSFYFLLPKKLSKMFRVPKRKR